MKNRYTKNLRDNNKKILELTPANQTLRLVTALEIKKATSLKSSVLEIGCGEGDSALYVLENTDLNLTLLDISPEMIESCRKKLKSFSKRVRYVCEDALTYLEKSKKHDVIYSEWTIHNFKIKDKEKLLNAIYNNIVDGGWFILMDKVYPSVEAENLLKKQLARFVYLDKKALKDITDHEKQDFLDEYRMNEKDIVLKLKEIGFKNISVIDRVERDIVIVAQKRK